MQTGDGSTEGGFFSLRERVVAPKGSSVLHEMIGLRISKMGDYFSPWALAVSCLWDCSV